MQDMSLAELIEHCREELLDESIGVRRSWEDMFRYTLMHYRKETMLQAFDVNDLEARLRAADVNSAMIEGYKKRWQAVLERVGKQ